MLKIILTMIIVSLFVLSIMAIYVEITRNLNIYEIVDLLPKGLSVFTVIYGIHSIQLVFKTRPNIIAKIAIVFPLFHALVYIYVNMIGSMLIVGTGSDRPGWYYILWSLIEAGYFFFAILGIYIIKKWVGVDYIRYRNKKKV